MYMHTHFFEIYYRKGEDITMIKVDIRKSLSNIEVHGNFTLNKGEILSIIGSSGCGKTTLLNMISGIINGDEGMVSIGDHIIFDSNKNINVELNKRNIGYIQQKHNLFPHLNVEKNILYGSKKNKSSMDLNNIIDILYIKDVLHKNIKELSGGQKQRVSIARTLLTNPKLLLMDEPFSALDNVIREKLREMVLQINQEFNLPIIFITHDLNEAYAIGNKVAIMDKGKILRIGTGDEIFQRPNTVSIAKFIGIKNIFSKDQKEFLLDKLNIDLNNLCPNVSLGIRSEDIILKEYNEDSNFTGKIINKIDKVNHIKYKVNIENTSILLDVSCYRKSKIIEKLKKDVKVSIVINNDDILYLSR